MTLHSKRGSRESSYKCNTAYNGDTTARTVTPKASTRTILYRGRTSTSDSTIDRPSYSIGDTITITGTVAETEPG